MDTKKLGVDVVLIPPENVTQLIIGALFTTHNTK